jgi:hypothetical protein
MQRELENGGSNEFDVLILDAFSGDAVPVHLLTEEAFDLYEKHLSDDGILAAHISNEYLDQSFDSQRSPTSEHGRGLDRGTCQSLVRGWQRLGIDIP